jgi:hypothetical protein
MSIHNIISTKISNFLNNIYYNYLIQIYENKIIKQNINIDSNIVSKNIEKNKINNIFNNNKLFIIKPEYFIYLQYYFIYTFFYYITNNTILYSISLHLIHICELIFKNLSLTHNYIPTNNINFLISTSYFVFIYLFFFKIFFLKIYFYYKIFFFTNFTLFYVLMSVNDIYNQRLECIILNKEFYHPLKFLILSPNKKFISNIANKTKFFTYSNFLLFTNLLLFLIL